MELLEPDGKRIATVLGLPKELKRASKHVDREQIMAAIEALDHNSKLLRQGAKNTSEIVDAHSETLTVLIMLLVGTPEQQADARRIAVEYLIPAGVERWKAVLEQEAAMRAATAQASVATAAPIVVNDSQAPAKPEGGS